MLQEYLELEGFEVTLAHDGESALTAVFSLAQKQPDVMVLDVMMPKLNGFDVLRALRLKSKLPVLMLTARGEDTDSIIGLELGADDYLGKPSNPRVLVARLRALLRRSQENDEPSEATTFSVDGLTIDSQARSAHLNNTVLDLTSTEFTLLYVLLKQAGQVLSKSQLSEAALDRPLSAYDRSIDMHISHLRQKLGPNQQHRIKTVRGVGYQLVVSQ